MQDQDPYASLPESKAATAKADDDPYASLPEPKSATATAKSDASLDRTLTNYAREGVEGVGRGLKNMVTGAYQTVVHPIDTITGLGKQAASSGRAALKEYQETKGAPLHQRIAAATLAGAEEAPIVGGAVQHAEKGGDKVFSPESLGAAAELGTYVAAPEAAVRAFKAAPIAARSALEKVTNTSARTAAGIAAKTAEDNAGEFAKASEKNAANAQSHLEKTRDALHETEGRELLYKQQVKAAEDAAKAEQDALDREHMGKVQKALEETRQKEDLYQQELRKAKLESDAAYQKKLAEVEEQRAQQAAARKAELKDYFSKRNALERSKADARTALDRKTAIERGVETLDPEIKSQLEATEDRVNAEANRRYNELAAKLNPEPASYTHVANALYEAAEKIKGTEVEPPILKSIKSKLASGGVTYEDLQGYRSELGRELRKGSLPGDIYHAYTGLQDGITSEMERIAKDRGMGEQFAGARDFYRRYAKTFIDKSSPVRKALKSTERGQTIRSFIGKDQSGIQQVAQFDPELAQRLNNVRGYAEEAKAIKPPTVKRAEPTLPPKPAPIAEPEPVATRQIAPPERTPIPDRPATIQPKPVAPPERVAPPDRPATVVPEQRVVNAEDIQNAKRKEVQGAAERIRNSNSGFVTTVAALDAIRSAMLGEWERVGVDVGARVAYGAGKAAIAKLLENPKVVDYLSKANAKDVEAIPSEMRGENLKPLLDAAKAKGIKVSTPLSRMVYGFPGASGAAMSGSNTKRLLEIRDQYAPQ